MAAIPLHHNNYVALVMVKLTLFYASFSPDRVSVYWVPNDEDVGGGELLFNGCMQMAGSRFGVAMPHDI